MSSSSSSNSNPCNVVVNSHDVFLSFRGEDTRSSFTTYLYEALKDKGYKIFFDNDGLKRGKAISTELLKAVEDSRGSVVVLSKNYASSRWCLTELAKIVECMETEKHIVLPIFYHVDPSHVRNQNGTYEEAFARHEKDSKLGSKDVENWRCALQKVGSLAGWTLEERDIEVTFIKNFTKEISRIIVVQKGLHNEPERQGNTVQPDTIFEGAHIVLPRTEIPAWFTNQSSGPTISIGLNQFTNYYGNWTGFILCALFRSNPSDHFHCQMKCLDDNWEVGTVRCPINGESSKYYIWIFYLSRDILPINWLNSSGRLEFSFHVESATFYNNNSCCGSCGFLLVYENDIQDLNKIISKYSNEPLRDQIDRNDAQISTQRYEDILSNMRVKLCEHQLERSAESQGRLGRLG